MSKVNSVLGDMHTRFLNLPYEFKTVVCEECGYSQATFYRKVKTSLSRAEKDMIVSIVEDMLLGLQEAINRYK